MPEQVDPYDLGDTSTITYDKPLPAAPAPATPETRVNAAGRPIDEHGRFLPTKTETPAEPQIDATPSPAPAAVAAPTHPAWVLRQAQEFGLDEEDLAQPTSVLAKQINRLLTQKAQHHSEMSKSWDAAKATVPQPAPKPPEPTVTDDLGIDENELAPALVQVLKNMKREQAALKKENEELKSGLGQVRNFQEQRINESITDWADRLFKDSGRKELFGDGSIRDLDNLSAEAVRRESVIEMAKRLAGKGATRANAVKKIPEAIKALYGEAVEVPKAKPAKTNGTSRITGEQWDDAALATPTHRTGAPELKGEQKAIARIQARYDEERAANNGEDEELGTFLK